MERKVSPWVWYLIGAFWLSWLVQALLLPSLGPKELSYTEFKAAVSADQVKEVQVASGTVRGTYLPEGEKEPRAFTTVRIDDPDLLRDLEEHGVKATGVPVSSFFQDALSWILPLVVFGLIWIFLLRRIGGQGQAGFMQIGQSKAKIYVEKDVKVSFADVAGVDEAKEELQEVIRYLKEPERFNRLGGTIPKGILLVGPPGTGKTLLARAVAGESGVPFFSISGSEFVEMFVGVGAARVRDLFQQAKSKAPCIIFIDELDALGKARGVGPMVHEEREQTLNQLLVELDGFDARTGVILMAATNRPEVLDPALLRAGRFDRHVLVDRPDKPGRLAILGVHATRVALSPQVNLEEIAAMTAGFVGADLANLVNEAALLAVRRDRSEVLQADLREAVERVIAGLEKKNRVLNPEEKRRVAHHEIGHALVAMSVPGADAVQKISIIPRGIAALGYTLQLPTEDRFLMTESELRGRIAVLLGGRVAEEIVFGDVSTGAQDDLRKATEIARSMVVSYGMSQKIGEVSLAVQEQPFLTPGQRTRGEYSEATAREIDTEIRRLIEEQRDRVEQTLREREPLLRRAAEVLLEKETISGEELASLAAGQRQAAAG